MSGPYNCVFKRIGNTPYVVCKYCDSVIQSDLPEENIHQLCMALCNKRPEPVNIGRLIKPPNQSK